MMFVFSVSLVSAVVIVGRFVLLSLRVFSYFVRIFVISVVVNRFISIIMGHTVVSVGLWCRCTSCYSVFDVVQAYVACISRLQAVVIARFTDSRMILV